MNPISVSPSSASTAPVAISRKQTSHGVSAEGSEKLFLLRLRNVLTEVDVFTSGCTTLDLVLGAEADARLLEMGLALGVQSRQVNTALCGTAISSAVPLQINLASATPQVPHLASKSTVCFRFGGPSPTAPLPPAPAPTPVPAAFLPLPPAAGLAEPDAAESVEVRVRLAVPDLRRDDESDWASGAGGAAPKKVEKPAGWAGETVGEGAEEGVGGG